MDYSIKVRNREPAKFLGLWIDDTLRWESHIQKTLKNVSKSTYLLRRMSGAFSTNILIMFYRGSIESILRYGIVLWGRSTQLKSLFIAQKKCIRIIAGCGYRDHCAPLFKRMKLMTLPSIYVYEAARFVKNNPTYFRANATDHDYPTRNRPVLRIPTTTTSFNGRSAHIHLMEVYNQIPADIRHLPPRAFGIKLKEHLLHECYYSVAEIL